VLSSNGLRRCDDGLIILLAGFFGLVGGIGFEVNLSNDIPLHDPFFLD